MQGDGNLVLYHGGSALWSTRTSGDNGAHAVMQGDGNLVVYLGGTAKWSSQTNGFSGASLALQDDSNLVIYHSGHPVWDWGSGYLGNRLKGGWTLQPGAFLLSPNHQYRLVMQGDGNLVLYHGGSALWSTRTSGENGAHAVMQGDGNLVVYLGGTAKWSSQTNGFSGASLALQDDSNLVIYHSGHPVWDWGSGYLGNRLKGGWTLQPGAFLLSPNHQYRLVMQGDGNLVLYHGGSALWSTRTSGDNGAHAVMQGDGNLVVYLGGTAKWSSQTNGFSGASLALQDDSNLVIYRGGAAVWDRVHGLLGGEGITEGQWPGTSGPVAAHEHYGYPYPNAPACTDGGACVLDSWDFYQGQCTSWVAYILNQLNKIGFTDYYGGHQWGNAESWGSVAVAEGIPVNGTPALGSVAWYASGHVAYVEEVKSSTKVVISEMNYDYDNGFRVHSITTSSGWPSGFIHIHDR